VLIEEVMQMPCPTMKSHQIEAARFLQAGRIRLLADDMGLGKTAAVIEAARLLGLRRVLICCPKSARERVWLREWHRFHPDDPSPITEMEHLADEIPDEDHVVCTFDFARVRYADLFIQGPWDCLVVDEWHEIRGTDAARTRAILHPTEGLVARSKRLWALSGTPIANHLGELYPLLKIAGVYDGSLDSFVRHFCMTYYDQNRGVLKITGARTDTLPELHDMIDRSGIMLRRLKKEVLPEIPDLVWEHVQIRKGEVDLEVLFPEWFEEAGWGDRRPLLRDLFARIEEQRAQMRNALGPDAPPVEKMSFSRSLEIVAGLAQSVPELLKLTGMQKVASVVQLVREELEAGLYPKIFLITRHTVVGEAIQCGLRDFGALRLWGGTTAKARGQMIEQFTEDPARRVFIGQVKACGPSVNLCAKGACYEVGVVEQSPVPGENNQAFTRPHRIGCTHEVRVRIFQLDDPIDRRWEELIMKKNIHIAKTMREGLFLSKEFDPVG
jgi:SNF2 family DNA or RNA helicase